MTQVYHLMTDMEGGRALARLLDQSRGQPAGVPVTPPPQGYSKSVVVRILADIAADDVTPHDAALMRVDADAWVDSMQRISIRNISTGPLRAEDRHLATPVPGIGYCVEALFE